jgi:hypothetical protein
MDAILLPDGVLRAPVWDPERRDAEICDVTDNLPYFLRSVVTLHDRVTLKDILLLADRHADFLVPLFTELLDEFVAEVKQPVPGEEICGLDYLEIQWESFSRKGRFDLQPILVGRIHQDDQIYSVEAIPTNAMGDLPVHLRTRFRLELDADEAPGRGRSGGGAALGEPDDDRTVRRDFTLFDVFDAVFAEITFHGPPAQRDTWWREHGSRGALDAESGGEGPGDDEFL